MKISVIGASGFLGKNFLNYINLNKSFKNSKVLATYNRNDPALDEIIKKAKNIKIIKRKVDLTKLNITKEITEKVELLLFFAGISSPKRISLKNYNKINKLALNQILRNALIHKVKKVIVLSSAEVLGYNFKLKPFDEKKFYNPQNNYAKSKVELEKICNKYHKKGLNINVIRPTTFYGKYDKQFIKFFRFNEFRFFPIRSKKKCIEYVHVEDVCRAICLVSKFAKSGEIFNLSSRKYSLNDILKFVEYATKKKWFKITVPFFLIKFFFKKTALRLTEYYFNSSSAKLQKLGYKENYFLKDKVKEIYEHYKKNKFYYE
jgi:nucleoside-diphosphate-sugar epimerase